MTKLQKKKQNKTKQKTIKGLHIRTYPTQQDHYDPQYGTLLHSYCTGTYTGVVVLLLWSSSTVTLEYPRRYSNQVAV